MEKKKKEGTVKMKEREGPDKSEEIQQSENIRKQVAIFFNIIEKTEKESFVKLEKLFSSMSLNIQENNFIKV